MFHLCFQILLSAAVWMIFPSHPAPTRYNIFPLGFLTLCYFFHMNILRYSKYIYSLAQSKQDDYRNKSTTFGVLSYLCAFMWQIWYTYCTSHNLCRVIFHISRTNAASSRLSFCSVFFYFNVAQKWKAKSEMQNKALSLPKHFESVAGLLCLCEEGCWCRCSQIARLQSGPVLSPL